MTYDAVLVARRGLGVEEHRLIDPVFAEAVRFAVFVEAHVPRLELLREVVATDPPKGLEGADLTKFRANRDLAREQLTELEGRLYPADDA